MKMNNRNNKKIDKNKILETIKVLERLLKKLKKSSMVKTATETLMMEKDLAKTKKINGENKLF